MTAADHPLAPSGKPPEGHGGGEVGCDDRLVGMVSLGEAVLVFAGTLAGLAVAARPLSATGAFALRRRGRRPRAAGRDRVPRSLSQLCVLRT
jgi:hypothetical protein